MEPEHLLANRQLRYAASAIRQRTTEEQDMEFCYPCPTTFLLPLSPAGQSVWHQGEPIQSKLPGQVL